MKAVFLCFNLCLSVILDNLSCSFTKEAHNAKELYALFDEGSKNRHTASTSMYQYIDLLLYINKMVSDMEVEQNSSQNSFAMAKMTSCYA
jgi:hypothetical protein